MHQIKYKAWDKLNKEMWIVEAVYKQSLKMVSGEWENREDFILLPYTGRKDKHGTKIYMDDILGGIVGQGIVCWNRKGAGFAINVNGELNEVKFEELEQKDLEVIGNIYQNPELLEMR